MNAGPDINEFGQLLQRWLDQLATAEEAARLWQMVGQYPGCAREMAAAARFESLLEQGCIDQSLQATAAGCLATLEQGATSPTMRWRTVPKQWVAAAAVLLVAGLIWFWSGGVASPPQAEVVVALPEPHVRVPASATRPFPATVHRRAVAKSPESAQLTADELETWLDRYFLAGVSLHDVPLREALGRLQAEMLRVNFFGADIDSRLRVTVSAEASGRRVTLESGPISFLKAVQAVAAQAGCDVEIKDRLLAVTVRRQNFPQLAKTQDLRKVLEGLPERNGLAVVDLPAEVEAVRQDAVNLGLLSAEGGYDGFARMTPGQLETLRRLAEARAQMAAMPPQNYQIGIVPQGTYGEDRVLAPEEVPQIRAAQSLVATDPVVSAQPGGPPVSVAPANQFPVMRIAVVPLGDGWQASIIPAEPILPEPRQLASGTVEPMVAAASNRGGAEGTDVVLNVGSGAIVSFSATTSGSTALHSSASNLQMLVLPTGQPPTSP